MASVRPRKTANGITYHARVRIKGAPAQSAVFPTKTAAQRWAQSLEAAIRERRYFPAAEERRHTLADAIDRYLLGLPLRQHRDSRNPTRLLAWWRGRLGHVRLADLTAALIAEVRDELLRMPLFPNGKHVTRTAKRRSPATVVRYLAALSPVLRTAKKEWGWLSSSPMDDVKKPSEPRGRVRWLSAEERERLLQACAESESHALEDVVVLALATGMRRGEILSLGWSTVDLDRAQITLTQTKNDERRTIPLVGPALALMRRRLAHRTANAKLVFSGLDQDTPVDIKKAWYNAVRRARLDDFRFHDLRHTAASYLAMAGCTHLEIAEVLGHKTLQMVKRYSHLSTDSTRLSLEKLSAAAFGCSPSASA